MANKTVASIIGYGLQVAKIGDDTGVPGLDTTDALVRVVDRENRNFIEAPYEEKQIGWEFMVDEVGYTVQSATTITGALTASSVTIPVTDTSAFVAAATNKDGVNAGGSFVIFTSNIPDIGFYTGRSASSGAGNLTGVTNLSFAHASTDAIYPLYTMPADFGRPRAELWRGDGLTINTIPYFYGGTGVPNGYMFSIAFDSTTTTSYLWLPRDLSGIALVRYDKAATVITTNAQTVDLTYRFDEYLIQKVASHVMTLLSKDPVKIQAADQAAEKVLTMAFARRSVSHRLNLTRRPIRSPSFLSVGHYMTSDGSIY